MACHRTKAGLFFQNTLIMEQINSVELLGIVGSVRLNTVADKEVINFSLATNYAYKSQDGESIIETTWHNVVAWERKEMPDFRQIKKGTVVHVLGRLKVHKYINSDGVEKTAFEVLASKLAIKDDIPQAQMGNA